jgi:hypothetical protein
VTSSSQYPACNYSDKVCKACIRKKCFEVPKRQERPLPDSLRDQPPSTHSHSLHHVRHGSQALRVPLVRRGARRTSNTDSRARPALPATLAPFGNRAASRSRGRGRGRRGRRRRLGRQRRRGRRRSQAPAPVAGQLVPPVAKHPSVKVRDHAGRAGLHDKSGHAAGAPVWWQMSVRKKGGE